MARFLPPFISTEVEKLWNKIGICSHGKGKVVPVLN
jgi:hypothetical protein